MYRFLALPLSLSLDENYIYEISFFLKQMVSKAFDSLGDRKKPEREEQHYENKYN